MPVGYPPTPIWWLRDKPGKRATLLAAGRHPVYVDREVYPDREYGFGSSWEDDVDAAETSIGWIDGWGARDPSLVAHSEADVTWTGDHGFVREVVRRRARRVAAWRRTRDHLRALGRITPEEVLRIVPKVEVVLADHRTYRPRDLPAIPPLPSRPPRRSPGV